MAKDYYKVLGVDKNASEDDLKSAYRKLAKEYHPDKNQGNKDAEAKFKEISEAYDVLKDPQKKSMYDQGAYDPQNSGAGNPFGGGNPFGNGFGGGNPFGGGGFSFEDIFDEMLGGGGGRRQQKSGPQAGSDLLYTLNITLEDAFLGNEREIKVTKLSSCDTCKGKGAEGSVEHTTCSHCEGRGKIRKKSAFFSIEQVCGSCAGVGRMIKNPCKTCRGEGRLNKPKTLVVQIPSGVDNGMKIRLSGEGEAGQAGARSGDLYIVISIVPHKTFTRKLDDLYMSISVPMFVAALGDTINITTIDSKELEITVPEGIQSGQRIRIKDRGFKGVNTNKKGDLYIDVNVETPNKLSKEQKKALEDLFAKNGDKKHKVLSR
jgi:molecular chaperone DnaJ